jgi:L-fucose dehydrogenase
MDLQLQNKIIVVSEGAKSISEHIIKVLAAEGAIPIIVGGHEHDNLRRVHVGELTKPEDCKKAIEQVLHEFGTIDGLVNNAAVFDGVGLQHGNYESFMASLHKNFDHYYLLAHYALPALKTSKGSIVNISSKTAETVQAGKPTYALSHGAINALTREWAVELLKYNIRVNAIVVAERHTPLYEKQINTLPDPGQLNETTSQIPFKKRMTTTEEIANMVAFLLSERSSHTTGQLIHVDGSNVHLERVLANAQL